MEMPEYYQDLREYLGVTDRDIEARGNNVSFRAAWKKAWDAKPRKTPEAIRSVYNETDAYLFRDVWYNYRAQQRQHAYTAQAIRRYCAQHADEVVRLVDYGCATARLEKPLLDIENLRITLADVPSPTLEFARWRYRNEEQVDFIEIEDQECLDQVYDIVVCCDVLEHLPMPMFVMQHLTKHHRAHGALFLYFSTNRPVGWCGAHLQESIDQYDTVMRYVTQNYESLGRQQYRKKT